MIVEEKLMLAPAAEPLVVFNVALLVSDAIPAIPMVPPLVVMFPPMLIAVLLELELVAEKLPIAVVDPIFPPRVIVPLEPAVKVSACDPATLPSTVEDKVMLAPAADKCVLFSATLFTREAIPEIAMVPPLVVMLPPRLMAVLLGLELVAEKFPSAVVAPTEDERVIVPLEPAVNVRDCDPLEAALTAEVKLMAAPAACKCVLLRATLLVKEAIPEIPMLPPLVVMLPPILMAVKLALVLVAKKFPSAVVDPTFPERVIVPDPAWRERACDPVVVPSIVLLKEILWLLFVMVLLPVKTTGSGNAREAVPFSVMFTPI